MWKGGYKRVACLDEAGRGPLAGPVVAAAVTINLKLKTKKEKRQLKTKNLLLKITKDSKKLIPRKREEIYKILINCSWIKWGIGIISPKIIDRVNILEATKLAMEKAIQKLKTKKEKLKIDYLILDGKIKLNLKIPQKAIVKADEKVFSCSAASIIAKVTRDRIMIRYHKKYPKYRFDLHKGYPTKLHLKMLKKYGPCKIHRKSFQPLRKFN